MYKIQLTLTPEETEILKLRAASLGYDVTKFVKFLISREAFSIIEHIPVTPMSEQLEADIDKAIREHKQGRSIRLADFNQKSGL